MTADIVLFSIKGKWLVAANGDGGTPPGKEFAGWKDGWYWQRRTPGKIEDGFGTPAGEARGPFKTDAKARLDLIVEYRRRAEERLGK
jgi:hypothetical protein